MHEAAYVLAAFALLSQLLALVRDRLLASSFGAGHTLDLYYAAFRIPDFLFATLASLLSLYALLPVLSRLEAEHPGIVVSFMRQMLACFFIGMGAVSAVAFIFAPQLAALAAPGLYQSGGAEFVLLVRILLLQPILLGASNILANLTQLRHRFVLYSVSPLLYNLGIIFGIVALYPLLGAAGLAWGVVLGAALHMLVQLPYFVREPASARLPWRAALRQLGQVLALSVPRTLSLAATQVSLLVLTAFASLLSAGSISVFTFAWNLQAVPLTIIGVSYSVAAFPTLSRLFAGGLPRSLSSTSRRRSGTSSFGRCRPRCLLSCCAPSWCA
jgi:putative peptidoglycan lipid II flippase